MVKPPRAFLATHFPQAPIIPKNHKGTMRGNPLFLTVTQQDTSQDKSLIHKEKSQDTPQDILHVTDQDTDQDTDPVEQLVAVLTGEISRAELQMVLQLKHRRHFATVYLRPALKAGLIEMTLPDTPTSRHQRYRRTTAGQALAEQIKRKNAPK